MEVDSVQLTISARPWIDGNANEVQQERTGARWQVQVQRKGDSSHRSVQLSDPFDTKQYGECRWYLDQFVQRSPYSVTRAAKEAEALNLYARSIVEQLELQSILKDAVHDDPLRLSTVSLTIEEDVSSEITIHRLHWELLEDPAVWQPLNVQVIVTRLLVPSSPSPSRLNRNDNHVATSRSINLLLVVARELSLGPTQYDDVDPSLATSILTNLQDQTRAKTGSVNLNVEIVRPGTRIAMEQHLQYVQDTRGPGYFDIVHFDLHGEVDSTEKTAYLLFDSEDGTLQRESAQEVAEILEKHSISSVVLNACESARADCGQDANIAQVFQQKGVNNVLAMSHKISSTAAELFITRFYHALLLNCLDFPAAAQEARAVLRSIPERDARFGLRRSLVDFHVPVTYMTKMKLDECVDTSPLDLKATTNIRAAKELLSKPKISHFCGRGFDLLRLEKLLQARRYVFISGPAGVGKTALLLEARKLWLKTKFVDILCMVNFSRAKITSSGEFMAQLVAQLPLGERGRRDMTDQMNEVVSKPSFEMSDLVTIFLKAISGRRCMFIFDGLHIAYTRWEDRILGFPGREAMDRINQFMDTLVRQTQEPQHLNNVYLVFADRVGTLTARLKAFIPYDLKDIAFPLTGLEMSDFITLAQAILEKNGYPQHEWTNSELNELELTLDLFQNLPGVAWQILPLIASVNIPRHQLQTYVHQGLCEMTVFLQEQELIKQLLHLSKSIKDGLFASFLILSLYWHDGPDLEDFSKTIASSGLCNDDDALTLILSLAFSQGFFWFTPDNESTIIHPLFTIYGRMIANSICRETIAKSQALSHSLIGRAGRWVTSLVTPTTEKQELAAVMVTSIWNDNLYGAPKHMSESVDALRDRFLDSVSTRSLSRWVSSHCKGTSFGKILSRWNGDLPNLQTCINICLGSQPLPIERWPLYFFQQQAAGIRMYGTTAQIALYAGELGRVFQSFIELNDGYALRPEHQFFGLSISSCLAAAYGNELRIPPKFEYYVQCGLDIAKQSELMYGSFTSFDTIYMKGLIMRYKALHLLEQGSQAEAEELWQSMLDLEESLWTDSNRRSAAFSEETADALVTNFSTDANDTDTVRAHVQAIAGRSVPHAYYNSRRQSMQLIKLVGERRRRGEDYEKSREYKAVMLQAGLGMERTLSALESTGVQDLDGDKRWWPENMDMLRHVRRYKNPRNRLDDLEEAQSSGNALAAAEHHQALLREAITQMDLDETGEHADALERIYEQDPAFAEQLQGVRNSKTMFTSLKSLLQVAKNGSTDAGRNPLDVFAGHFNVLAGAGVSQEVVDAFGINMQILAKDREQYGDESVTSTGIGEDTEKAMARGMRRLMANIGDPEFLKEFPRISLSMMNLLKEIQDAESSRDIEAEQKALAKYEEFSKLPIARDMVDQAWIVGRRKEINRKIMWKPHLDKWTKAMSLLDFENARASIEEMEYEQPDKWSSTWASAKLLEVHETTEKMHWNTINDKAMSAMNRGEFEKAADEFDKLLDLHSLSKFNHLDPQSMTTAFYATKTNQLLSHINIAVRAAKWDKALALCNEWFAFTEGRHEAEITTKRDQFLDLKEACELQIHIRGYQEAVQDLKTADAMKHLMALYALSERQSQMPDLERNLATLITKEMLNEWQQKVLLMRITQSFRSLMVESDSDDAEEELVSARVNPETQEGKVARETVDEGQEHGETPSQENERNEVEALLIQAFYDATQRAVDARKDKIRAEVAEDGEK